MEPSSTVLAREGTVAPPDALPWVWFVAVLFITIHSVSRFNSPPTNRADTTMARYWSAALLYSFANICLWLVLVACPDLLGFAFDDVKRIVPLALKELSLPFVAALLVTSLLPHVPWLANMDTKLRLFFLEIAQIPNESLRLTRLLHSSPLSYPGAPVIGEIRQFMEIEGFDARKHTIFGSDGPYPQRLWTKIRTILYWFHQWETDRRFSTFRRAYANEFLVLERRYRDLSPVAREVFRLHDSDVNDSRTSVAIDLFTRGFLADANLLEQDMCRLISRAMLKSTVRESARNAVLSSMGFSVSEQTYPLFDKLLGLSSVLGVAYAGLLVAVRPADRAIATSIVLGIGIASIYWTAIFWALWSRRYRFAMRSNRGRSSGGYIVATTIATLCAFVIGWVLQSILETSMIRGLSAQKIVWPWILMAGITAFMTAFLADTRPEDFLALSPYLVGMKDRLHWFDAALLAVATGLTVIAVHYLLLQECLRSYTEFQCALPERVPPLSRLVFNAIATGAIIGWYVPRWYRASIDAERLLSTDPSQRSTQGEQADIPTSIVI